MRTGGWLELRALVHQLITRAHLPRQEIAHMTREEAISRMQQFWTSERVRIAVAAAGL